MPQRIGEAVAHQSAERCLQNLRVVGHETAAEAVKEILHAPAADHGVVGQNHEGRENGYAAHDRESRSAEVLECMQGRTAAGASHDEFGDQQRDADRERKDNVRNDEARAAVDAGPEREFPNGAQANCRACAGQNKADPGTPSCCGGSHVFFGLFVLSEGERKAPAVSRLLSEVDLVQGLLGC